MSPPDPLSTLARTLPTGDLPPERRERTRWRAHRALARAARTPAWLAAFDLAWDRTEPRLVFAMGLFYLGWAVAVISAL